MARAVHLHPEAYADIRQIVRFIARRVSIATALRWQARLESAVGRLADEADRQPEADEATDLGIPLRMMLHGRRPHVYRILFTIEGQTVVIHRVRHAAQDRLSEGD